MGKSGCIRAKVVVLEQKWFYSGKVVVVRESGCIRAKMCYSGKVVVFEQKLLYSGIVFLFGQM